MWMTQANDPGYLEVNAEHLNRFLQGLGPEHCIDSARLKQLPSWPGDASQELNDTLISGGMHGQMGLPGLRCKG